MARSHPPKQVAHRNGHHKRLRFNWSLVCQHLQLGPVPPDILDVAGVCSRLHIKRSALDKLLQKGLPATDINPRSLGERQP